MNIALLLQMAAEAGGDRTGLVCDGRRWSYSELFEAAQRAAVVFRDSGAAYVALLDESSEAAPIALFGAALAGIPYVPLNYRLADADLGALIDRIEPALLIGDATRASAIASKRPKALSRSDFQTALKSVSAETVDDSEQPIAAQIFTSGTTSAPKAALLKHTNLMGYILGTVEFMSAAEEEAALVCVPPYHIAGIAALLSSIYSMRKLVLLPAFTPEAWLDLVEAERVTNAFVVPTMLARIVAAQESGHSADVTSLKALAYGGGRMPRELIEIALDRFPETGFTNAYGLTETSSTIALLGPEDHRLAHASTDPMVRERLSSVGQPLPTVEIEIRDDNGQVLPAGEPGEIYVRGEQVSGEYQGKSALIEGGWFPTRDQGYLDGEGYLFLGGRADDVIVRGGENMAPAEIEDALSAHPAVQESAAVGVPSAEWGETVAVAVVLRASAEPISEVDVKEHIRTSLRSSRVPEYVTFVDALPYNEMGKLLRREIKQWFDVH
jgi:acyl-CoA synthetase (AMP-forming)/AMP-acid ligase II